MARPLKLNRIRVHRAGTRRRHFDGFRNDATGFPALPFRVEQISVEGEHHSGLEHIADRGPEPRLPLRTCSSRSSDVTVKQANTYVCRKSSAADGERYDSLVEDAGYLPKPARPFSAAMVPRGGIEPPTPAFSVQCSTN